MAEMRPYVDIIFWTAVVAIAYTYAGYPLLLMLLSKLVGKPVRRRDFTPDVTVIIAAYNEERDLAQKLENTLALDYPKEKLEILVTSDCSTDRTDEIVRSFANRGVRLHRQVERHGKTQHPIGGEELLRQPDMRAGDDVTCCELAIEARDAARHQRILELHRQIAQPQSQQRLVGSILQVDPCVSAGAKVMVGRGPLNKYGGE